MPYGGLLCCLLLMRLEKLVQERKQQLHSGTPERLAAACPDELPMVLSRFTGLLHDIKGVELGQLRRREALQAGIQQLNGKFYVALLAAAAKQHAEEMRRSNRQDGQGVIPASWLRA
ncbi:hypothetical protein COO60DRAFT_1460257 [Scenedesmus sp. NREL 46B-D3]|nr:hypothetical protein COO60DRAFT_1460257 [Scenedesmus sp. NREL 46B-D3]